jgi:large subunit ribosomal protein L14e
MVDSSVAGLRFGQKVTSLQGRDRGRTYLIIGILNEYYVLVADGVHRSAQQPKKKNRRHLSVSTLVDEGIEEKLRSGGRVTDEEITSAIRRWEEKAEEGEISLG